jgi:hypothetical protein
MRSEPPVGAPDGAHTTPRTWNCRWIDARLRVLSTIQALPPPISPVQRSTLVSGCMGAPRSRRLTGTCCSFRQRHAWLRHIQVSFACHFRSFTLHPDPTVAAFTSEFQTPVSRLDSFSHLPASSCMAHFGRFPRFQSNTVDSTQRTTRNTPSRGRRHETRRDRFLPDRTKKQ